MHNFLARYVILYGVWIWAEWIEFLFEWFFFRSFRFYLSLGRMRMCKTCVDMYIYIQLFSLSLLFKSLSFVLRVQLATFYAFNLNVWLCSLQNIKCKRKENWKRHDRICIVCIIVLWLLLLLLLLLTAHHTNIGKTIFAQNCTRLAPAATQHPPAMVKGNQNWSE